ncbi:MAG: restriction endonuclease [Sphingomonadales bacterium]
MQPIAPSEVRYIKLGQAGAWEAPSLARGELHFGYRMVPHELCLTGDWDAVTDILMRHGRTLGKARDGAREIRDFYTLGRDCLWITFHGKYLWWAFADPQVTGLGEPADEHGAKMRRTLDGWRNTNILGEPLYMDALSTRLTQVAAYRQTICSVQTPDYLVRRINGVEEPMIARALSARKELLAAASEMIAALHWADFEVMVDLIFTRSGWQRTSTVGGTMKDADLVLWQPTTGERAMVQVKSKANQANLNDYIQRFRTAGPFDRIFFVCHTPRGHLEVTQDRALHVWSGNDLAAAATTAGLFDWLIEKSG